MTQLSQSSLNRSKLVKVLKKSLKKVVSQNGINSATRNGNKELDLLLETIAQNPFTSTEQVEKVGNTIGSRIVELSQNKGKNNLDKGVIRELSPEEFISPELFKSPAVASPVQKEKLAQTPLSAPPEEEVIEKPSDEVELVTKDEDTATLQAKPAIEAEPITVDTSADKPLAEADTKDNQVPVGLKYRIGEDIKTAMKAKDKIRLEAVRSIKKALIEKEVALRPSGQENLTNEQEIELLAQQAKQRRESIEQYQKAGRDDLAEKEVMELAIIETYLPAQLSEDQLGEILDQIITEVGAKTPKDIGLVMGVAMKQLKGKADGKQIQAMVKEKLTQN